MEPNRIKKGRLDGMALSWPGKVEAGTVENRYVSATDILPTIAGAAVIAEAVMRSLGDPLPFINAIRERANTKPLTTIDEKAILDDCARELAFEGQRWFMGAIKIAKFDIEIYTMRLIFIAITSMLICSCVSTNKTSSFAKNVVVAHRGAWKAQGLPENSIAALKHAVALKCTGSEFDVQMTSDEILVINHDAQYEGMSISETSYANLAVHKLSNGEKLPTLREYILAGLENNTTTRLVCEIKPAKTVERGQKMAEKTLQLIKELNAEDMTVYISFEYEILKKIEEINPKAHTQYLEANKSPEELKADGIDGADYNFKAFKKHPEWIESAKKIGIALNAWTVNDPADMDWLLEEGFDFITTNEPELLLEKIRKP